MGVADQIRALEKAIADLNRRLNDKISLSGSLPLHHTTHESGGGDAIKLDDLSPPDDNTDLNATITKHGLLRKLDNDPTHYLDGQGNLTVPAGGGGAANVYYHPDRFPAVPTAQSDHFDDGAIAAKWVDFNVGVNLTKSESEHLLRFVKTSEVADVIRGIYQTLPAGDFTLTAKLSFPGVGGTWATKIAIALYEDAMNNPLTCDIYTWGFYLTGAHSLNLLCQYYTAYNVYNTNDYNAAPFSYMGAVYFRIRQSTTTWYFDFSLDNLVWKNIYSRARRFVPAEFGFCCGNSSGATETFWIDWIYYEPTANMTPPVGRAG